MSIPRSDLRLAVEAHIAAMPFADMAPANLYQPIHYILKLKGKRIRPVLTLLAYEAVSGREPAEALNLGCSLELFHNFTLMHDDIMDRAPVRRGQPTVHKVWNENIAILSGDALFAFSMGLVVQDFPQKAAPLALEFTRVAMEVCEGQMEDMDLADMPQADIPAYIEMIRKKTAVLLGGCMTMGSMAAGADADLTERFRKFGENLGIGFQLQDDLMDAFPPEGFGKQIGGDIIEGKKTFLLLKAMELADASQRADLTRLLGPETSESDRVDGVLSIFQALHIKDITEAKIKEYYDVAGELAQELDQRCDFTKIRAYLEEIFHRKI
ncbi:MAG: polyprenyl synthetase family protein [Bacteroidia bacterium]|nr:polyprenyl synthetase family protein [Bacteroidia bacterium]